MNEIKTGHNSTFAIGGASCSADSFVVTESSILRMNICGEKPAHRKPVTVMPNAMATVLRTNISA